jgi:hypothetical protein
LIFIYLEIDLEIKNLKTIDENSTKKEKTKMVKDLRRESELISKKSLKEVENEKSFIEKQLNEEASINLNNQNTNNLNISISKKTKAKCPTCCNISRVLTLFLLAIIIFGLVWFLFSNDSNDDEDRKLFSLKLKALNRTSNNRTTPSNLNFGLNQNRITTNETSSSQNDFYSSNLFVFIATLSIVLLIILFVFVGSIMPYLKRSIKSETFSGRSIALSVFYDDRYNQDMIDCLEKDEKKAKKLKNNKKDKSYSKNASNCGIKNAYVPKIVINTV